MGKISFEADGQTYQLDLDSLREEQKSQANGANIEHDKVPEIDPLAAFLNKEGLNEKPADSFGID